MKRLKKQRRMLGLTQSELSRLAGIALWRIAFAETGRVRLTSKELGKIKAALARRATEVATELAVGKPQTPAAV
jgi:predicted transcriptional regulator